MTEKAVRRKKKKEDQDEGKPTDEETAIARYLRFYLPTKSCNFMGNKVEYFTGSKAVDFLMDSKWASGAKKTPIIFTHRESVTSYLDILLQKGFYIRALKVAVKKKEPKESEGKKKTKKAKKSEKEKESSQEIGEKKEKKEKGKSEETGDKKQKEGKRKVKLEGTNEQIFVDGNDAYVWIFDPIKPLHYVYGFALVIGAIAVCLFPLWPPWMRVGTYYLSIGGACLVGSIVVLAIVRTIIYGIIWGATFGKVSWWLFPNLLADVGILESFQPVYAVEYSTQEGKGGGKKEEANQESDEESKKNDNEEKNDDEEKNDNEEKNDTEEKNIEELGIKEEKSEHQEQISEDGPSENVQESLGTESGHDGSNNEDEVSQTSEKSESSSSQGTKDFEVVQKEDVVGADPVEVDA